MFESAIYAHKLISAQCLNYRAAFSSFNSVTVMIFGGCELEREN